MRKALSVRQRSGHKNVRLLDSTTERGDGSGRVVLKVLAVLIRVVLLAETVAVLLLV